MLEILQTPALWLTTVAAFFLGAAIGSFLNVVIDRYPKIQQREVNDAVASMTNHLIPPELACFYEHESKKRQPLSLALPASHCDGCNRPLSWYENVPIISWLLLRGKCRTCGVRIPGRVLWVELFCATYAATVVWFFGMTPFAVMACLALFVALPLALIDMDTQELPDPMVYILLWAGLLFSAGGISMVSLQTAVVNAVFFYCLLWSLSRLMPGKLGGGDVKLVAAFSVYLTFHNALYMLILSCVLGLVFVLGGWLANKVSHGKVCAKFRSLRIPFPFGPAICLGGIGVFWWQNIRWLF